MPGIQDLIATVTQGLGVSNGAATAGVGGLLGVLKSKLGAQFGEVAKAIPGADAAANAAPAGGGLLGKLGGLLGGGAGSVGAVAGMLAKAGISADKLPSFLKMFVDFLKSKLSPDLLKSIVEKIPALKGIVG